MSESMGSYDMDDVIWIRGTFHDPLTYDERRPDISLVDPTTVTLTIRNATHDELVAEHTVAAPWSGSEITRVSLGVFQCKVTLDSSGEWRYFWKSTGAAAGATPTKTIYVRPRTI